MTKDFEQFFIGRERRCGCTIITARKAEIRSCKLYGRVPGKLPNKLQMQYIESRGPAMGNPSLYTMTAWNRFTKDKYPAPDFGSWTQRQGLPSHAV